MPFPTLLPLPFQAEKERLSAEAKELKQRTRFLQEQLAPVTKQREYQEKEIQRLNKVGLLPGTPQALGFCVALLQPRAHSPHCPYLSAKQLRPCSTSHAAWPALCHASQSFAQKPTPLQAAAIPGTRL